MSQLYIHDNFFAGTVAESLPRSYTSASLAEIVASTVPGIVPAEVFGSSLSFPQDIASSVQSVKPRGFVGA
eukprot:6338874-Amphidinium_carterae.1